MLASFHVAYKTSAQFLAGLARQRQPKVLWAGAEAHGDAVYNTLVTPLDKGTSCLQYTGDVAPFRILSEESDKP